MKYTDTLDGRPITYVHVGDRPTDEAWDGMTLGMLDVPADDVPTLVRAGAEVWTYGYGWDDSDTGDFTTLSDDDLWAWDDAAADVVVGWWGPFACEIADWQRVIR